FTYSSSSTDPFTYDFSTYLTNPSNTSWIIDGQNQGSGNNFSYTFQQTGMHQVCLINKDGCHSCINICIAENKILDDKPENSKKNLSGQSTTALDNSQSPEINITPNPTKNRWKIDLKSGNKEVVYIKLFNLKGQIMKTFNEPIK